MSETRAYNRLVVEHGIEPHIAAGIVGNLKHESAGMNPRALGDNGTAFGLAQWRGDRRENLEGFARARGVEAADFDAQVDFVAHELKGSGAHGGGSERAAWGRLQKAETVEDAARTFMQAYERPAASAARRSLPERTQFAQAAFSGGTLADGRPTQRPADLNTAYASLAPTPAAALPQALPDMPSFTGFGSFATPTPMSERTFGGYQRAGNATLVGGRQASLGGVPVDLNALQPQALGAVRDIAANFPAGRAVQVNSGARTRAQNASLSGSASNSLHLGGRAFDLNAVGMTPREQEMSARVALQRGATEFGLRDNYLHVGFRDGERRNIYNRAGVPDWVDQSTFPGAPSFRSEMARTGGVFADTTPAPPLAGSAQVARLGIQDAPFTSREGVPTRSVRTTAQGPSPAARQATATAQAFTGAPAPAMASLPSTSRMSSGRVEGMGGFAPTQRGVEGRGRDALNFRGMERDIPGAQIYDGFGDFGRMASAAPARASQPARPGSANSTGPASYGSASRAQAAIAPARTGGGFGGTFDAPAPSYAPQSARARSPNSMGPGTYGAAGGTLATPASGALASAVAPAPVQAPAQAPMQAPSAMPTRRPDMPRPQAAPPLSLAPDLSRPRAGPLSLAPDAPGRMRAAPNLLDGINDALRAAPQAIGNALTSAASQGFGGIAQGLNERFGDYYGGDMFRAAPGMNDATNFNQMDRSFRGPDAPNLMDAFARDFGGMFGNDAPQQQQQQQAPQQQGGGFFDNVFGGFGDVGAAQGGGGYGGNWSW